MGLGQKVAIRIAAGLAFILVIWVARAYEAAVGVEAQEHIRGEQPGNERDDNELKMKFVWCPPGIFEMGEVGNGLIAPVEEDDADVDGPVEVSLTRGYWLGKYEVTKGQWNQVMHSQPWQREVSPPGVGGVPKTNVSWNDAMKFCRKLTKREREAGRLSEGWEYSLPTEAQWERACRARTNTMYSFGDDESKLGEYAWFVGNVGDDRFAHRVGQKRPNLWGLHDMHGNVREWCRDAYDYLPGGRDPEVEEGELRVARGGSWTNPGEGCQSACRIPADPSIMDKEMGFRVALSSVR